MLLSGYQKLIERKKYSVIKNNICVGLDFLESYDYNTYTNLISNTAGQAFCFKINPAFFGKNYNMMIKVIDFLNNNNITWIYDGKIGDVFHTNKSYADYIFNDLNAHGVTLNPFVGYHALKPFTNFKNKINFLLCITSNPSSETIQDCFFDDVCKMSEKLSCGLVIAGNKKDYLKKVIKTYPEKKILSPGIGAQGGSINNEIKSNNIIYNISRSIIYSKDPSYELEKYAKQQ